MGAGEKVRIALRYTFSLGQGYLSTFLSSLSMMGLILACGLLIVVLSVMNGFDREMRQHILALVPHITLYSQLPMTEADAALATIRDHPDTERALAFSRNEALLINGVEIESAQILGLPTEQLGDRFLATLEEGVYERFTADPQSIVLGQELAHNLAVQAGDKLRVVVPSAGTELSAKGARFRSFTVAGIATTGTQLDQAAAFIPLQQGVVLADNPGEITGIQVFITDIFDAPRVAWELLNNLPTGFYAINWEMTHGNLYAAIQLSRRLVTLLLLSIIAVAAFNVVSSLVLVVADKQRDIAILRTMGATKGDVTRLFLLQGAVIGLVGASLGGLLGVAGSTVITDVVAALEAALEINFLRTDVYPVSYLPSDLKSADVLLVAGVSLLMCLLASIYPARRAASLSPALILHHD